MPRSITVVMEPHESTSRVLVIELTDHEWEKLERLAAHQSKAYKRKVTPGEAARNMICSCMPGGSGWKPPGTTNTGIGGA